MRVEAWTSAGIGELQPTNKNYGARSSRYAMVLDTDMKVEVVLKVQIPLTDCLDRTLGDSCRTHPFLRAHEFVRVCCPRGQFRWIHPSALTA